MDKILLVCLLISAGCSLLSAQGLTGWSNRQTVFVTESSGNNLVNYQVRVDVVFQPNMNVDFSDLRFTTNDGTTLIDYWVEVFQSGTSAVVWVEIPTLAASLTDSIYLYYGNASATSASNGTATFVFFDDFTTYAGWTNTGGGGAAHDVTTFPGSSVLRKQGACDPSGMWKSIGSTVSNCRMISREIRLGTFSDCPWNRYGIENTSFNGYSIRRNADQGSGAREFGYERRNNGSASNAFNSNMNHPRGSWYRTELAKDCATGGIETILFDDNKVQIGRQAGTDNAYCSFDRVVVRGGRDYYMDYIAIANYTTNTPQVSFSNSPILLSFDKLDVEVVYTKEGNLLTWVLEEVNEVVNFEVAYSADATNFEVFEEIDVYGNNYDYLDLNYRGGTIAYYRVAALMLNGETRYSEIKAVELPTNTQMVTILPNPVSTDLQVIFELEQASLLQVMVIDINGQSVRNTTRQAKAGQQKIHINLSDLPSGMYSLVLSDGISNRVRRFIKK